MAYVMKEVLCYYSVMNLRTKRQTDWYPPTEHYMKEALRYQQLLEYKYGVPTAIVPIRARKIVNTVTNQ